MFSADRMGYEQLARPVWNALTTRWSGIAEGDGLIMVGFVDERPLAISWSEPSETRAGFAEIHSFYTHPDGWAPEPGKSPVAEAAGGGEADAKNSLFAAGPSARARQAAR